MGNEKIKLWYMECCTGCTCCSYEDFYQGFYQNKEEAEAVKSEYLLGHENPLGSQYAKHGKYYISECEAEVLPDGRVIVEDTVFPSKNFNGRLEF